MTEGSAEAGVAPADRGCRRLWFTFALLDPEHYLDLANVMLSHGLISDRAQRMAEDIYSDYDFAKARAPCSACSSTATSSSPT